MENKKAIADDQLDRASGGTAGGVQADEKKNLIRSLYDEGSRLEIAAEQELTKLEKAVSELLRPQGRDRGD